jgi:dolichol-phosphate mannosyltransferase
MIKIILCCLNEEKTLPSFLQNLINEISKITNNFEILICLDGTTDNSLAVINNLKIKQIKTLPIIKKRGLGLAFKRLFLEAVNFCENDDLIISLDADNTHNPAQIHEMLNHFKKNNLDFLVAARFCENSVMTKFPIHRKLISKATSILLQTLFPIKKINSKKLQDYTSGFRIYKAEKLKELYEKQGENFILEPEFTYTCELLIKLSALQIRIDEIAISYDYEKKIEKSKLRIMRNFYRLIAMIKNLIFHLPK